MYEVQKHRDSSHGLLYNQTYKADKAQDVPAQSI
jgi:hypothetical protein